MSRLPLLAQERAVLEQSAWSLVPYGFAHNKSPWATRRLLDEVAIVGLPHALSSVRMAATV